MGSIPVVCLPQKPGRIRYGFYRAFILSFLLRFMSTVSEIRVILDYNNSPQIQGDAHLAKVF